MTDAGTVEVTETIEHLDEELPCFVQDCDNEAAWLVIWECKCHHFVCQDHRDALIENQRRFPEFLRVQCTQCKKIIDSKTEVIPL